MNCKNCGKEMGNTNYGTEKKPKCPICHLGTKEGSQSKYWEKSIVPKSEGFRYADDAAKYDDKYDYKLKKWVKLDEL